jgi:hypothetical protein
MVRVAGWFAAGVRRIEMRRCVRVGLILGPAALACALLLRDVHGLLIDPGSMRSWPMTSLGCAAGRIGLSDVVMLPLPHGVWIL